MALLKIIKLSTKTWKHNSDIDGDFILTKFYAKQEDNDFLLVESYGAKRRKYKINEIEVYDIGGSAETFADFDALFLRLEVLKYPAFYVDGEFTFNPASYDLSEFQNAETDKFVKESEVLSNDISTYTPATTPLSGTELALIDDGTGFKKVAVSELGGASDTQVYKTISANTTLDDTYHNAVIWVTATCNITIPSGLRTDFTANIRTFTGATATYLTSGTVINTESDGDVQAPKTMANISTYSTNNFIISGGGLS